MIDVLFMVLPAPPLFSSIIVTLLLACASLAVSSPKADRAGDRHFVLMLTVLGCLGVILLSWFLRVVTGVGPDWFWLADSPVVIGVSLGVFMLGSVVLIARLTLGMFATSLMIGAGAQVSNGRIHDRLRRVSQELRMPPALVVRSVRCRSPLTTGMFNPVVILPWEASDWDDDHLDAVLIHEHAHIARRDCLWQFALQCLGAFLWWNPMYWVIVRQGATWREVACDEWVTDRRFDESWYANLLLDCAARKTQFGAIGFATVSMAGGPLRRRIEMILEKPRLSGFGVSRAACIKLVVFAVVLIPMTDILGRATIELIMLEGELDTTGVGLYEGHAAR